MTSPAPDVVVSDGYVHITADVVLTPEEAQIFAECVLEASREASPSPKPSTSTPGDGDARD